METTNKFIEISTTINQLGELLWLKWLRGFSKLQYGTEEKSSDIQVHLYRNFMTFQWSTSEEKATHPCEVCKGKTDKTAALTSRDWSHNITTIFGQQLQQVPSKSGQTLHNRALQEHIIYTLHHFSNHPRPPKHHTILIPIYSSVVIGPYRPRGRQSTFWRHCQTELDLPILQSLDLWPWRCWRCSKGWETVEFWTTLQDSNISHPGRKENHFQNAFKSGYVGSLEGGQLTASRSDIILGRFDLFSGANC